MRLWRWRMFRRIVISWCFAVWYIIGSEVRGSTHEHRRRTKFEPNGFSRRQPPLRETGAGKLLPTDVRLVLQVALYEPRVLLNVFQHYGEWRVLVQALNEKLGVCMQHPTLLRFDRCEASLDPPADTTFGRAAAAIHILAWKTEVTIVAVGTIRAHVDAEQESVREHDHRAEHHRRWRMNRTP